VCLIDSDLIGLGKIEAVRSASPFEDRVLRLRAVVEREGAPQIPERLL
jgi:hypothetical protein